MLDALFVALFGSVDVGFRGLAKRGELFLQRGDDVGEGRPGDGVFQVVGVVSIRFRLEILAIFPQQRDVFPGFAVIKPDDGAEILELPFAPFVQRAIDDGIVISGVDKQNLVSNRLALGLVEKPEGTRQRFGIEEVVADRDHDVDVTRLDELFADILILPLTVRRGGRHDESGASAIVEIGIEIGNPQIVRVADLFILVHARHTEGKPPGAFAAFRLDLVHVDNDRSNCGRRGRTCSPRRRI